jgi:hypothetical protein
MNPAPDRLEKFFDYLRYANPFLSDRVTAPSKLDIDVSAVHSRPFHSLVRLARQAHTADFGIGAVLWGEAGVGKSHLLSRLWRWADQDERATFVFLHNLQAEPKLLPRYVLANIISELTFCKQSGFHDTPLYRLVKRAILEGERLIGAAKPRSADFLQRAYRTLIDHLMEEDRHRPVKLDRNACQALLRFYLSANLAHHKGHDEELARLAVTWLAGDRLEPDDARKLGIVGARDEDGLVGLRDDEQIKQVLYTLTKLSRHHEHTFLLCFDQVDNLEADRLQALARFLHALLDCCSNLVVIFSGVERTLQEFRERRVLQQSTWDRIALHRVEVLRVKREEGRAILEARLEKALEPFADIPEVQRARSQDPLFPLGGQWFEERTRDALEFRPRDVIRWARERWEGQQQLLESMSATDWLQRWPVETKTGGERKEVPLEDLIDRAVAEKLAEHKALLMDKPHTLPPSADNLAGLLHTLLGQCRAPDGSLPLLGVERGRAARPTQKPPCDLVIRLPSPGQEGEVTVGVACICTDNATSTTASLRRFAPEKDCLARLLLVTEERRPLKVGPAGRECLNSLRRLGPDRFREALLSFDEYADLDALEAAVNSARSGDLEITLPGGGSRPVTAKEVIASHHRQGRYLDQTLLRLLLTWEGSPGQDTGEKVEQPRVPIDTRGVREFIMAQLALTMGSSSQELGARLQEHLAGSGMRPRSGEECKEILEQAARQLHAEGQINASPMSGGLYLLPRMLVASV